MTLKTNQAEYFRNLELTFLETKTTLYKTYSLVDIFNLAFRVNFYIKELQNPLSLAGFDLHTDIKSAYYKSLMKAKEEIENILDTRLISNMHTIPITSITNATQRVKSLQSQIKKYSVTDNFNTPMLALRYECEFYEMYLEYVTPIANLANKSSFIL